MSELSEPARFSSKAWKLSELSLSIITRKLSYCKDDRAMRPMYGRPENFKESLTMHTATFYEFLMGFCSD